MSIRFRKTWKTGENVTPEKANSYISDVISYMGDKNLKILQINQELTQGYNDPTGFERISIPLIVSLETQENETVRVWLCGVISTNYLSTTAIHKMDVKVDDEYFLSSQDAIPATDGIMTHRSLLAPEPDIVCNEFFLTGMTEGVHTFELLVQSRTDHQMIIYPNFQFGVESYGVNIGNLIAANHT